MVVLAVDFEEGFKGFLTFAFVLELVFAGLAATLGSLTSFFAVAFFAVSLDSLAAVSFLLAGFFVAEDFAALVAVAVDLDFEVDFAGVFFAEVALDVFAGLFYSGYELCS